MVSLISEEAACVRMLMGQHLLAIAVNLYMKALIMEAWTWPSGGETRGFILWSLTGSREASATISFPFKGRGGVIISNFEFGLVSTVICFSA